MNRETKAAREIEQEKEYPSGHHESADGGHQIEQIEIAPGQIGLDPARHTHQAGQVHGEESDVKTREHQPEDPLPDTLR